jgi:hypothetical protein
MRIPFRQGIIRYQTDNAAPNPNPTFLEKTEGGSYIDLIVAPDPTLITFAHGDMDYLFEEKITVRKAWGPFTTGQDYWLYWDIDLATGQRTFGYTTIKPKTSHTEPTDKVVDLHWFDKTNMKMKVWNGAHFVEKIRVFAAEYKNGNVLKPYPLGSQVGIETVVNAGFILFDEDGNPVRNVGKRGRGIKFYTTETHFASHHSRAAIFKFESVIEHAKAIENIAAFQLVTLEGANQVGLADSRYPDKDVYGVASEDLYTGEVGPIITNGYIRNNGWNFTEPAGTRLFCGETGIITTSVPQSGFIQQVGTIVSPTAVYIDIGPQILLET